jgi:hypothetical protein
VRQDFNPNAYVTAYGTLHRDQDHSNAAFGALAQQRFGNYTLNGEAMRVEDTDFSGNAYHYGLEYFVPKIFLVARAMYIEPDFKPALGLISFTDMRGYYWLGNYFEDYPKGWIKQQFIEIFSSAYEHFDGKRFNHGYDINYMITSRDKHGLSIGYDNRTYDGLHDAVMSLGYQYGENDRFRNYSLGYSWGEREGQPYRLYTAGAAQRLFKKLDLGFQVASQHFQGIEEQYIVTAGWELDPKRAISGRLVRSGNNINAYLAYRSSGFKGAEVYVIVGDPNAERFRSRIAIKVIIPVGG